ncbi:hypothetical protein AWB71_04914 [Caballeronia peredens]|nr:hypothetical protein AWB71_04914 [Caballeronia peredens]
MKSVSHLVAVVAAFALSACVSLSAIEPSDATPDDQSGYIASSVNAESSAGYAIYLQNTQTKAEFVLKLSGRTLRQDGARPQEPGTQVHAIKVPPGNYVATRYVTFGWVTNGIMTENAVDPNSMLAVPFAVAKRSVVFLGKFSTSDHMVGKQRLDTLTTYVIAGHSITSETARATFAGAYPAFKDLPFTCRTCTSKDGSRKYPFSM